MSNQFTPHKMEWDQASIAQFWNMRTNDDAENYFSRQRGDAILDFVQKKANIALQGNVVDYGCGPGYLMEKLVQRGIACEGVDYSEDSIKNVSKLLGGNPLFKGAKVVNGAKSPLADNYADALFFIETIEHILDQDLSNVSKELYRVIKPNGYIIITTPHEEDLLKGEQQCPECGCQSHYMQHVQSWSVQRLSKLMEDHGFKTVRCEGTLFRIKRSKLNWLRDIYANMRNEKKEHLIYIGQKPTA